MTDIGSVKMSSGVYVYFEKSTQQEDTYISYVMVPKNGKIVLSRDVKDIKDYIEGWEHYIKKEGW